MSTDSTGPTPAPGADTLVAGQVVGDGRYVLKKVLGQGGMGVVWLAHDKRLREPVALKFLPPQIAFDPAALEHLRRETWRSRKLSHPNIVRIHDLHEGDGERPFLTMEYVDGLDLHRLRATRPGGVLTWGFLAPLLRQLCAALAYAHEEKVIHRDLKPANLMLDSGGRLKLADFGLACVIHDSMARLTGQAGVGTLDFMSPQQADGKVPQPSDDIYSLGASLYDLLTSTPPFHRGDISYQLRHNRPESMEHRLAELELTNEIPSAVAALVMSCLAKAPEQRPPNAQAIIEWLDSVANPSPATPAWTPAAGIEAPYNPAPIDPSLAASGTLADLPEPSEAAASTSTQGFVESYSPVAAPSAAPSPQTDRQTTTFPTVLVVLTGVAVAAMILLAGLVVFLLWNRGGGVPQSRETSPPTPPPTELTVESRPATPPSAAPAAPAARPRAAVSGAHESPIPHAGRVHSVAASPNGYIVASGSEDAMVGLWLPRHRRILPPLLGHKGPVFSVAFSPGDSRRLLSGGADGTARLWDVTTATWLWKQAGSGHPVTAVQFDADGTKVICADASGQIAWREAESGTFLRRISAHAPGVIRLALSQDGKWLASAGGDATIRLWDTASGMPLKTFDGLPSSMTSLSFSPDGRTLAAAGGEPRYHLFDMPLGVLKRTTHAFNTTVNALVFQPDGEWLVVNGDGRTSGLQLSAADGGLRGYVFPNGTSNITTLAVTGDGLRVYGTAEGRVGHAQGGVHGPSLTTDPFGPPDPGRIVQRVRPVEPPAEVVPPQGWIRLINGGSLRGWEQLGNGQWTVERDGTVTSRGNAGALLTRTAYENFELRADVRFAYGGAGALGFRIPTGAEAGAGGFSTRVQNDIPPNVSLDPVLAKLATIHGHVVPHDTWATLRVVAKGNQYQAFLNDRLTVNMSPAAPSPRGHIALLHQVPGAAVSYRNVMIKPLAP